MMELLINVLFPVLFPILFQNFSPKAREDHFVQYSLLIIIPYTLFQFLLCGLGQAAELEARTLTEQHPLETILVVLQPGDINRRNE
jgi:hypothetical protein